MASAAVKEPWTPAKIITPWEIMSRAQRNRSLNYWQRTFKCPDCSGPLVYSDNRTYVLHTLHCRFRRFRKDITNVNDD